MSLAAPVSRSNFHYNGDLYVEVGTLDRHKRATIEEISAILRPDLKKKSTKLSIDAPKDQVGHWYEAQLIHYGLPPLKDKARAKMRLLEALNSTRLAVPPHIAKMEAEMKREYTAAERKAKAQYKASMKPAKEPEGLVAGKKRKQSEPAGNTNSININISLGNDFRGPSGVANASEGQSPAKKARTGPLKPTNTKKTAAAKDKASTKKPPTSNDDKKDSRVKQEPKSEGKKQIQKPPSSNDNIKDSKVKQEPKVESKKQIKKSPSSTDNTKESKVKQEPKSEGKTQIKKSPTSNVIEKDSKVKQELKIEGKPQIKKESGDSKEPKTTAKSKVKKEPSTKPPPQIKPEPDSSTSHTHSLPAVGFINGTYDLSCDTIESQWDSTDLKLTLTLEGATVWGAYDLGVYSGILFLPTRPWHVSNEALPFTYRGRGIYEGEMSFGQGCVGEISFLGNGRIEGW
ncbi:hypothetical protein P7C71_g6037, partial [Lecanoromycetidae sp. Uapishka_2]